MKIHFFTVSIQELKESPEKATKFDEEQRRMVGESINILNQWLRSWWYHDKWMLHSLIDKRIRKSKAMPKLQIIHLSIS